MTEWRKVARRKEEVRDRAAQESSIFRYCRILGCGQLARAGTQDGLDERYCRRHYDHLQRHGDPIRSSYTAAQLRPHRLKAHAWLTDHAEDQWVVNAAQRVMRLYADAGRPVEAFRLRGLNPRQRAWAAWARLREAGVDPLKPVEAWLTVELAIAADPDPNNKREFRQVQAAKLVHRMASGTHKTWSPLVIQDPNNPFLKVSVPRELHVYPRSRGRVLRHIGSDLEAAAEIVADRMNDPTLTMGQSNLVRI